MALQGFWGFDDANAAEPGTNGRKGAIGRNGTGGCLTTPATSAARSPFTSGVVGGWVYWSGSGASLLTMVSSGSVLSLAFDGTGRVVMTRKYNGDFTAHLATSSLSVAITPGWHLIELRASVTPSGGRAVVRLNSGTSPFIDFTGDTGSGPISSIEWMTSGGLRWDDCYMVDTAGVAPYNDFLGDVEVLVLLPTGNGSASNWVGSDGDTVDNYALVNEPDADTSTYVATPDTGIKDLYLLGDVPVDRSILAVQHDLYAAKSAAGTPPTTHIVDAVNGAERSEVLPVGLSTTWQRIGGSIHTLAPDGQQWTVNRVIDLQAGMETVP